MANTSSVVGTVRAIEEYLVVSSSNWPACRAVREKEVEPSRLNQLMAALSVQSETLTAQSALLTKQAEAMSQQVEAMAMMLGPLQELESAVPITDSMPAYNEIVHQPVAPQLLVCFACGVPHWKRNCPRLGDREYKTTVSGNGESLTLHY